ncbi:MAG: cell division protein FtsZ, partial [Telluria sp.]
MSDLKNPKPETVIKVIGVGGAGGNAVNHMASAGLSDIEFICANTDAQALSHTGAATRIQLGESGLGAGSDPVVGRESAIRER